VILIVRIYLQDTFSVKIVVGGDYAANLAAAVKKWFWGPLPVYEPGKPPFFITKLSCGRHDSASFAEKVIVPKFLAYHLRAVLAWGS